MKKVLSVLLALTLLLGLTACGASAPTMNYKSEAAAAAPMELTEEMAADTAYGLQENGAPAEAAMPENRKWVITVFLDAETEDLDTMMEQLNAQIQAAQGYVENQSIYNGSNHNTHRFRNANMTIRIPADQVDFFVSEMSSFSNVVSHDQNKEDITLTYVATESRLAALETEQDRLLELLAQAETMEDLLTIEARLTDVRYELEKAATQMRLFDNQVDYATIHLSIQEVRMYTPIEEPDVWTRITEGFTHTIEDVADGAVDLFVWIVVNSPWLAIYGALLFIAVKLWKQRKNRKEGKPRRKLWKRRKAAASEPFEYEIPKEGNSEE